MKLARLVPLAVAGLLAATAPAQAAVLSGQTARTARGVTGQNEEVRLTKGTFPAQGSVGPRDYYVAAPDVPAEPRTLVVFLHGCYQTAPDAATGTRIAAAATARGWFVVLPEQRPFQGNDTSDGNGSHCWNWFLPQHQVRDGGEPATIAGITRTVADLHAIDPGRVFVAGISAGADMTTVMGATHPDLFSAIATLAGCAYLTCADVSGAAAHAAMGEHARLLPALVAQGTADMVNNAAMGDTSLRQWLGTNDRADDGQLNGSVPPHPTDVETSGDGVEVAPGEGDPCVGNRRLPCAGGAAGVAGSYPYTVSTYSTAQGVTAVEHWLIHGLNHAYPGGDPRGTFVDPLKPDLTNAMLDFFARNARSAGRDGATAGGATTGSTRPTPAPQRPAPVLPATGGSFSPMFVLAALASALILRRTR